MTTTAQTFDGLDTVGFARLHALVARGYRPILGAADRSDARTCIAFTHPRASRADPPPPITLWSDGIVATTKVLFPKKFVPEEGKAPPDWQRYILAGEVERFEAFLAEIALPGILDCHVKPLLAGLKVLTLRLVVGASLCTVLGLAAKLIFKI